MAEQVVALLVEKVGQLLINEARFMCRVHDQLEELQAELRQMCCFLKDVDGRHEESETLQDLVIDIRKVTCNAEDVLELYAFKVSSSRRRNVLLRFACIFNEGIAIYRVGSKIDIIKIKISKLTASLERNGIRPVREREEGPSSSHERLNQIRRSYSHIIEEDVVGFDKDIKILVEKLVNQYTDHRVVSIFGMGGLGKTTLAKKVYHHPDVRRHFDNFAWVCISQNWQMMDVLKGIIIKLNPERKWEIKRMTEAELVRQLYEIQQQKKCLVALDDIWSHDVWDTLRPAFPDRDSTGSRILLTTRKEGVAFHIDRCAFQHRLGFLNREESWQLLLKKAFPGRRGPEPRVETQMEKKGREMLQRCGDVPLAIVVLGGLLANRHTLNEWERVHRSLDRYLMGEGIDIQDKRVQQVLALSYNDLPYQLKSCFLYMGNFQEDYNLSTEKLCLLWIAEGVVVPEDKWEEETMMDVAERYLGELARRSMVEVESSNEEWFCSYWNIAKPWETCRLHDLMRELCLSKRKKEYSQSHGNVHDSSSSSTGITKTHKLAIYFGLPIDIPDLKEFKFLRVLDFEGFSFGQKRIPEGLGKLIHLKYLSFRNCWVEWKLPSSIGNLQFLQILDIRGTCISIPNLLWKLESLRHLYLPEASCPTKKLTLAGLSSLEILENFDTSTCVMKDLFKLPELQNLKANVMVECREELETIINYLNGTSHKLRQLTLRVILNIWEEELFLVLRKVFTFCSLQRLVLVGKIVKLPEYRHDHFSMSLTEIALRSSGLTEDPMTTLEKLPNLQTLKLCDKAYVGNEMVCSAGGFPQLRILILDNLTILENWRVDEGALPALSSLSISYCKEMKMLPEGLKFLTNLQELRIFGMPEAFGNKVRGENSYVIRHVPSVTINNELP